MVATCIYASGVGANVSVTSGSLATDNTGIPVGNGIQILNGGAIEMTSCNISGFAIGIDNSDGGGAGSSITVSSCYMSLNTIDINIVNAFTIGTFNGQATYSKIIRNPANTTFSWNFTDIVSGELEIFNTLNVTFQSGTHTEILGAISNQGVGLTSGGVISIVSPTLPAEIAISDLEGYYINGFGELAKAILSSIPNIIFGSDGQFYVYVDGVGAIATSVSEPASSTTIMLGRVSIYLGAISFIDELPAPLTNTTINYGSIALDIFGPLFVNGSQVTANGGNPLQLDVQAGRYYSGSVEFNPVAGTSVAFDAYYRSAIPGSWIIESPTPSPNVPTGFWDDGSGTLQAVTGGWFVKHSLYLLGNIQKYFLVYAQAQYLLQVDAVNGPLSTPPDFFNGGITPIAALVVQQGAASIADIISIRPFPTTAASNTAGVTSHLALSDLTAGDAGHTQFLLLNGSTPMSGNLDMGSSAINPSIAGTLVVDGVTVAAHASRHQPGGADPLPTAAPVTIGTANIEGTATSFARSDHVHNHGAQTDPSLHALAVADPGGSAGFMSGTDKQKLDNLIPVTGVNTGDQIIQLTGMVVGGPSALPVANLTSFATTVVTNANLTGVVTSVGNATSIANGAISDAMLANTAVANLSGINTGDQTISITGQVTAPASAGILTATLVNSAVTGQPITGFVSSSGIITAADTILTAIDKLDGNVNAKQPAGNYITALTGDATATGPGSSAIIVSKIATTTAPTSNTYFPVFTDSSTGAPSKILDVTSGLSVVIGASNTTATLVATAVNTNKLGSGSTLPITSRSNLALGDDTLNSVSLTGINNTAVGQNAGTAITSGSNNTALGQNAGSAITTSSNNILIGNTGVVGDSGVIRLGTVLTNTACYIPMPIINRLVATSLTGNQTFTVATAFVPPTGGIIIKTGGAATWTFGVGFGTSLSGLLSNVAVGDAIQVTIVNSAAGNITFAVAVGSGVTNSPLTTVLASTRQIITFRNTGVGLWQLY